MSHIVTKKVKDVLKKTDPFLWMLELCRLILVLIIFLKKLNCSYGGKLGSRGGGQTKVWEG
jgi:hypothetical protein